MWLAARVAPFLCGDTGSLRDMEHVLWEVRLTVLLQLCHWKLRALDVWTLEPELPLGEEGERIFQAATSATTKPQL